jgi:hypothetical protein
MTDAGYENRQQLEMFTWPELMEPPSSAWQRS